MKNTREITRVREHGTEVTNSTQAVDPGQARIDAVRRIVEEKQYAKVDGLMVDLFSASCIVQVHDHLNAENQAKFRSMPIYRMADVALKLIK